MQAVSPPPYNLATFASDISTAVWPDRLTCHSECSATFAPLFGFCVGRNLCFVHHGFIIQRTEAQEAEARAQLDANIRDALARAKLLSLAVQMRGAFGQDRQVGQA